MTLSLIKCCLVDGSTALHQACHDGNDLALRMLLQYGGDFTIQDTQGRAPIHWAVTTRSTECLKVRCRKNSNVFLHIKSVEI